MAVGFSKLLLDVSGMALAIAFLIMALHVFSAVAGMMKIEAKSGQNVTLPCNATRYTPIKTLEWSRADQNKHIIFCHNQKSDPLVLETCYKGRVLLGDRKQGNASLTLKNVTANDTGIYECYVQGGTSRTKRAVQLISTIRLQVKDNKDGVDHIEASRGHAIAAVPVMFVAVVIIALIGWKKTEIFRCSHKDDAEQHQRCP